MQRTEFIFKAVEDEGETIHLLANIWYSKESPRQKRPIALYFHGGGYIVGSKDDVSLLHVELLVQQGFVVVSPNYRLCPTIAAPDGPIKDCMDCYSRAQDDLPHLMRDRTGIELDPDKLVTMGISCGASIAHFASQMPKPPAAILDIAGMKYLDDPYYHSPSAKVAEMPDFDKDFIDKIWSEMPPPVATAWPFNDAGPPDMSQPRTCWMFQQQKNGMLYKSICPAGHTTCIDPAQFFSGLDYPPTCFVNGTADTLVDVKFAKRAYSELKDRGVECELILAEGHDHGFEGEVKRGEAGFDFLQRAFDFLTRHV